MNSTGAELLTTNSGQCPTTDLWVGPQNLDLILRFLADFTAVLAEGLELKTSLALLTPAGTHALRMQRIIIKMAVHIYTLLSLVQDPGINHQIEKS